MNVWTYWKCPSCKSIIRGDSRTCPHCGSPIPSDVKYLMPDNPEVEQAVHSGAVLTEENRVVEEPVTVVPTEQERESPNWICAYCNSQNWSESTVCEGCGASRTEAEKDYFGETLNGTSENVSETTSEPPCDTSSDDETFPNRIRNFFSGNKKTIALSVAAVFIISFLVWLFFPITRSAKIQSFEWERSIAVEEYTLCHESGWSVPSGGTITSQKEEIHHYNKILDHYETKTRQVARKVQDGYKTTYKDLGNGQAKAVKTPKYKTVYETETYKEPVYRKVPEYRTKYYYNIGRWKQSNSINTSGSGKKAVWGECSYPSTVSFPSYGDKRQGTKSEAYYAVIYDEKGESHRAKYAYSEWQELSEGDTITYKTFRFSQKPLNS